MIYVHLQSVQCTLISNFILLIQLLMEEAANTLQKQKQIRDLVFPSEVIVSAY